MKKRLIYFIALALVAGCVSAIYKYFFEEQVDYYTIKYIPPYKDSYENPYDDFGVYEYVKPKVEVEKNNYSNYYKTDEEVVAYEEKLFSDYKKTMATAADREHVKNLLNPKDAIEEEMMDAARANIVREGASQQRWLISIRYKRSKTPEDLCEEMKEHIKDIIVGKYVPSGDFKVKIYELKAI